MGERIATGVRKRTLEIRNERSLAVWLANGDTIDDCRRGRGVAAKSACLDLRVGRSVLMEADHATPPHHGAPDVLLARLAAEFANRSRRVRGGVPSATQAEVAIGLLRARLLSYVRHVAKTDDERDDLIGEVIARVWIATPDAGPAELPSLIIHVAREVCREHVAASRRVSASLSEDVAAAAIQDAPMDTLGTDESRDQRQEWVAQLLKHLNAEQRQAIKLRIVKARSYVEIGRMLGISEGAARVRVHRALLRLRDVAEKQPPPPVAD